MASALKDLNKKLESIQNIVEKKIIKEAKEKRKRKNRRRVRELKHRPEVLGRKISRVV